jgi:tetratricopeptide (TPR) repeat protein
MAIVATLAFAVQAETLEPQFFETLDKDYAVVAGLGPLWDLERRIDQWRGRHGETDALAWRTARIYFSMGERSSEEAAHRFYQRCLQSATAAIRLNPQSAHGYFYRGICTGKIGQLEGLWSSLDKISPLKDDMETVIRLDPAVSHGGAHRALGKLYLALPRILGGDPDKAIHHLQEAVRLGPRYGDNYLFLAEAYLDKQEDDRARETLNALVQITRVNTGDPGAESSRRQAEKLLLKIDGISAP